MSTLLDSPAAVGAASSVPFGFQLSDDRLAVRKMVREFAESEIAPHVMEWDEAQLFPRDVMARLGDLGMLGVLLQHLPVHRLGLRQPSGTMVLPRGLHQGTRTNPGQQRDHGRISRNIFTVGRVRTWGK